MKAIRLKEGTLVEVAFLSKKDSTRELLGYINDMIEENTFFLQDKKFTLKQEEEWKKAQLEGFRKRTVFSILARIDGRIAGSTQATQGRGKEKANILLGIGVAKKYRRLGLGEALLKLNIKTAKKFFKPKPRNIHLCVFGNNKPARALYRKIGFREFARYPKWISHKGRYVDNIVMKL